MLTERQAEAHRFIFEFIREKERSPSLKEVANGIGSKNVGTGGHHVQMLIRKGFLQRDKEYQLCVLKPPPMRAFKAVYLPLSEQQILVEVAA